MKNEISDFMELRDQFDVRLQGCSNDCKEYRRATASEVRQIERLGVNCCEPSDEDAEAGREAARILGITYCFYNLTPKTSIYL